MGKDVRVQAEVGAGLKTATGEERGEGLGPGHRGGRSFLSKSRSVGTSLCLVLPGFNPSSPQITVMFSMKVSQSLSLHSVYRAREILPLLTAVKGRSWQA